MKLAPSVVGSVLLAFFAGCSRPSAVAEAEEAPLEPPQQAAIEVAEVTEVDLGKAFDGPAWNTAVGLGGGAGHRAGRAGRAFRSEPSSTARYAQVGENPFLATKDAPLSTFSADVDTASYANVRRMLQAGQLPPAGAVRIEEMLNYFRYDYPGVPADVPFSVTSEVAACPWAPRHQLVLIGLRGREFEDRLLPPRNLTFLLDVSGSMQPSNRLPLVQRALAMLVRQLRAQDHVAIVAYAGASGVVLEPTAGSEQGKILAAIRELRAGGSTNGASGIRLAYDLTRAHFDKEGINRVVLATDGDFNVGTTSESELVGLIEKERASGVFLTVLGVGDDNLNDSTMKKLSTHGNGNYAYLDSLQEAAKVLVREAGGTLVTIAKDVKLQVEFNPVRVEAYRLIGYENRVLAARDFNDDQKDAGDIGAGHTVTALYEVVPVGVQDPSGSVDPLKYQEVRAVAGAAASDELLTLKLRYKAPDGDASKLLSTIVRSATGAIGSDNLRLASALAGFGMLLSDSKHKGTASYAQVAELLRGMRTSDHGERAELLDLVLQAQRLAAVRPAGTR